MRKNIPSNVSLATVVLYTEPPSSFSSTRNNRLATRFLSAIQNNSLFRTRWIYPPWGSIRKAQGAHFTEVLRFLLKFHVFWWNLVIFEKIWWSLPKNHKITWKFTKFRQNSWKFGKDSKIPGEVSLLGFSTQCQSI